MKRLCGHDATAVVVQPSHAIVGVLPLVVSLVVLAAGRPLTGPSLFFDDDACVVVYLGLLTGWLAHPGPADTSAVMIVLHGPDLFLGLIRGEL
jgi:hypothetical protein